MTTLKEFIDLKLSNAWVEHLGMGLYVRDGYHLVHVAYDNKSVMRTFDIANMETPEGLRGRGKLWDTISWLDSYLDRNRFKAIYIENVFNPRLAASLGARVGCDGWIKQPMNPPCFVRML